MEKINHKTYKNYMDVKVSLLALDHAKRHKPNS